MKKRFTVLVALIGCLAIGSVAVAMAKSGGKQVSTKASLSYLDPGSDPYALPIFEGKVKAGEGCKAKRRISIDGVGKGKSSKSGVFQISSSSSIDPGKYRAEIKEKTIKDGRKEIVCKAGKSKAVNVS